MRSKHAGFCFGVKRAVDRVMKEIGKGKGTVYTLGPIIHNPQISVPMVSRRRKRNI